MMGGVGEGLGGLLGGMTETVGLACATVQPTSATDRTTIAPARKHLALTGVEYACIVPCPPTLTPTSLGVVTAAVSQLPDTTSVIPDIGAAVRRQSQWPSSAPRFFWRSISQEWLRLSADLRRRMPERRSWRRIDNGARRNRRGIETDAE
jgi:hypothetical protein